MIAAEPPLSTLLPTAPSSSKTCSVEASIAKTRSKSWTVLHSPSAAPAGSSRSSFTCRWIPASSSPVGTAASAAVFFLGGRSRQTTRTQPFISSISLSSRSRSSSMRSRASSLSRRAASDSASADVVSAMFASRFDFVCSSTAFFSSNAATSASAASIASARSRSSTS